MDPATMSQVIAALMAIAKIVETLGPSGLLALALAGPIVLLVAILLLSYWHGLKQSRMLDAYRKDIAQQLDERRKETEAILKELGSSVREISQYYKDNVELVKAWERIAGNFQDMVVANTRTLERLCNDVEHHQFCPVVREKGGLW